MHNNTCLTTLDPTCLPAKENTETYVAKGSTMEECGILDMFT
jgi:hypothetical protein